MGRNEGEEGIHNGDLRLPEESLCSQGSQMHAFLQTLARELPPSVSNTEIQDTLSSLD